MRRRRVPQSILCTAVVGAMLAAQASAQLSSQSSESPQQLAKDSVNPFADVIKLPIQFTAGFGVGPEHRAGESLNIQPVVPFTLSDDWLLIARPSLNVTYAPSPDAQFGLQDLQASFFLTPAKNTTWLWAAGPIFQMPTATSRELGTGRWSAGPTAALIYDNGPWFCGVLTYHLMSFAGDRGRGSVNQTYIEPQISYSLDSGWYGQVDPAITYDWTAEMANAWTIPLGVDLGKAFQIGNHAMSVQVGAYDYLMYPDGAPQWIFRAQMTFLFPEK